VTELLGNPVVWYGASALAYVLLCIGLLLRGGGLLRRHMLAVAVGGIAWSVYFAMTVDPSVDGSAAFRLDSASFFVDVFFMLAWFALLYRLLRGPYRQSMPETVRRSLYLFWGMVLLSGLVVTWIVYLGDGSAGAGSYYHVIAFSVSLMCFGLSAQLNRDAPVENTLTLHSIVAAGGVMSGSQALLLGVATLAGSVLPSMLVLRIVAISSAGLILLYAVWRRPQWSLEIFVSPQARAYLPRLLPMLVVLVIVCSH